MWLQLNDDDRRSDVRKIKQSWKPINVMLIKILVVLLGLIIVHESNALPPSNNEQKNASISALNIAPLKEKLEKFRTKYKATLLNDTFLPFLSNCNGLLDFPSIPKDKRLCITYYDMIFNIYDFSGYENRDDISKTLNDLDNVTSVNFCNNFPDEIKTILENQPFAKAFNMINWIDSVDCAKYCIIEEINNKRHISDICKLISGGSRSIHKIKIDEKTDVKIVTNTESNSKISIANPETVSNQIAPVAPAPAAPEAPAPSVAPADLIVKIPLENDENAQPNTNETVQYKMAEKSKTIASDVAKPPNPNLSPNLNSVNNVADEDSSEQNNEQKTDDNAYDEETGDLDANADESIVSHNADLQPENRHESKSNNNRQQSQLQADEFQEDTESSFFSYFMFLMFVIVSFYVAYHNKSKILALLIEGRRSRTYSSRNGSRRKSHSAEYRKLDSNLEEAIQSGGSQTLSTQIIY